MTTRCEVHRCRERASAEVCRTEYGRYQACPDHALEATNNGEKVSQYSDAIEPCAECGGTGRRHIKTTFVEMSLRCPCLDSGSRTKGQESR